MGLSDIVKCIEFDVTDDKLIKSLQLKKDMTSLPCHTHTA